MPGAPPEGLLGHVVMLDDVGPIRRRRAHPVAKAIVGPLLGSTALLVGGLVLLPTVLVVVEAFTGEGGFVLASEGTGRVYDLEGLAGVVGRTLIWAIAVPALITIVALTMAFSLPRRPGRLLGTVLLAPAAVPLVVTGVTFRLLYHPSPDRGLATRLLGGIPGDGGWLGPGAITIALIGAFVWIWLGLTALVFRAALNRLPPGLAIVARASGRRLLGSQALAVFHDAYWKPGLQRVAGVMYVLVAIVGVRALDLFLVTAPGSVLDDARVLSVMHYQQTAESGTPAALGTLWLFALVAVLVVAAWTWPGPNRDDPDRPDGADRAGYGPDTRASALPKAAVAAIKLFVISLWLAPLSALGFTALHDPRAAAIGDWWSLGSGSFGTLWDGRFIGSLVMTGVLSITVCLLAVVVASLAVRAIDRMSSLSVWVAFVIVVAAAIVPLQVIAGPVNNIFDGLESSTPYGPVVGYLAGSTGLALLRLALVHGALAVPVCIVVLMAAGARGVELATWTWAGTPPEAGDWSTVRRCWKAFTTFVRSLDQEPAVITALVLAFLQVWNDFVVGLFVAGPEPATPLGLLLYGQTRQFVTNSGPLAAESVVMLAVPLLLVVVLRDHLIGGLIGTSPRPARARQTRP